MSNSDPRCDTTPCSAAEFSKALLMVTHGFAEKLQEQKRRGLRSVGFEAPATGKATAEQIAEAAERGFVCRWNGTVTWVQAGACGERGQGMKLSLKSDH